MREQAAQLWNGLLDLIYPPRCLVCAVRMEAGALCAACLRDIQPVQPPFCDRCGVPIPADQMVCAACAEGPEPPFAWSQAMGQYVGTLQKAIHRLKYDGKTALARPLGQLLAQSLDQPPSPLLAGPDGRTGFDAVVPIPLHPARLRQRGFNQAERIACVLAQERGWRLDTRGLRRVRPTRTQTGFGLTERAANVQGVFATREPLGYAGQSILLVDDVLTTSATVREAARVVREAGATRVCVVALARGG